MGHFTYLQEEKWFSEELQKEVQRLQNVITEGGDNKGEVCLPGIGRISHPKVT